MQRLEVREPVPYPILVGEGVLKEVPPLAGPAALLFDRRVEGFAQEVAKALGVRHLLGLPGGEAAKSLEVYGKVLSWLAEKGLPRNATLLVVGGGTLTDLGGFVAATYLRGWPTSPSPPPPWPSWTRAWGEDRDQPARGEEPGGGLPLPPRGLRRA